ncbi:MAG TPA: ABC transporter substrate-binding protein [Gaiellaceae bacterium]|nr:ABC transporter substrate-binding protein [Gaiellaceae bacterium]
MHKKLSLSVAMMVIGACLLVASSFAGAASASAQKAGSSEVKRGGTLRLNASNTDFEYTDPALAYDSLGWQMLFAVNMTLMNYPDKPGAEGSRLIPEAAAGFPRVSRDGKTYTFTIRRGIKFSDGSAVTAAAFKRAFERAADPKQASPAIAFMHTIVGADRRNAGSAGSISGVTAKGQTFTVKLTQADPTFLAEVAMPFFAAVKPSMPVDPKGISVYPSAGPYKIDSRDVGRQLVLVRNPQYKGSRPQNVDRIVYTVNTDLNQSLLQVRAGQVDYDAGGLPPTAHDALSKEFGVKKGGPGRYYVNSVISTTYLAMNTIGGPLGKVGNRKAVNFAIDRPALLRVAGKFAGARTDQILPPNMRGFKQADIYPLKGANPARAKQASGGDNSELTVLHTTSATSQARAQVLQFNFTQAGFKVKLKPQPFAVAIKTAGTKSQAQAGDFDMFLIGWLADYPDPFDFINVLLDGDNIQDANNSNYAYLNNKAYNVRMKQAAKLSGDARYKAYGQLDIDLMKNLAPWAPLSNGNTREFISNRLTNYIYHPVYSGMIVNAVAIK